MLLFIGWYLKSCVRATFQAVRDSNIAPSNKKSVLSSAAAEDNRRRFCRFDFLFFFYFSLVFSRVNNVHGLRKPYSMAATTLRPYCFICNQHVISSPHSGLPLAPPLGPRAHGVRGRHGRVGRAPPLRPPHAAAGHTAVRARARTGLPRTPAHGAVPGSGRHHVRVG